MTLREQIKAINTALSQTMDLYRIWAKKKNINYHALLILYTLADCGECTPTAISKWWALPKQTVNGILRNFQNKGLIVMESAASDKREKVVILTERGQEFSDSILTPLHDREERAMKKLGPTACRDLLMTSQEYCNLFKKEIINE